MNDATTHATAGLPPLVARRPALPPGRLTTLALLGGAVGALPIPYVPDVLTRRIRGAVVHDVAARHGLSLTDDARAAMAEPTAGAAPGRLRRTVTFFARRTLQRMGGLGLLPPVASWFQVYALGLLFDRYLEHFRASSRVRITVPEAAGVRRAIDLALGRVITFGAPPSVSQGTSAAEDLRDGSTRFIDEMLLGVASIPSRMQRRLETAFDAIVQESAPDGTASADAKGPSTGSASESVHV